MGAQSTVATATAIANKPTFEDGGFVGGANGGRQGVDNREIVAGDNEYVMTVADQKEFLKLMKGGGASSQPNITINAVSSEGVEDAVLSALYNAQQNNKVDNTILSIGAN